MGSDGGDGDGGDSLAGRVKIDGSSTVYPITEAVAEEFMLTHPRVRITVSQSGTGGGFSKFLRGETDINDASRPISPEEIEQARANDIGFVELPVAYDGLAVVVHPSNDWVECLTVEELRAIWKPRSEIDRWNQVRPDFPDRPLALYGAGTASGTYDYFTEAIMGESGASRADFTASEDDNVLVQGVVGDKDALGFFGLAYYENSADRLKAVAIDDGDPTNGDGCVAPSPETVADGTYQPLSRPLFIYVRADRAGDPTVDAFVNFYLDNVDALAREVGYVELSGAAYRLARARYANPVTGSLFSAQGGATVGVRVEDLLRGAPADTTSTPADTTTASADSRAAAE